MTVSSTLSNEPDTAISRYDSSLLVSAQTLGYFFLFSDRTTVVRRGKDPFQWVKAAAQQDGSPLVPDCIVQIL